MIVFRKLGQSASETSLYLELRYLGYLQSKRWKRLEGRILTDSALRVVLNGLQDRSWGSFHRSAAVRFFVHENNLRIGIGEGNIKEWERQSLRFSPISHKWLKVERLEKTSVPGIKYVPEEKVPGMPRSLIPVENQQAWLFTDDQECTVFPAYRCFDINLGEGRILSAISPKSVVEDTVETTHLVFQKERYRGKVDNVEVNMDAMSRFFEKGYGIGILRKAGSPMTRKTMEAFPILGNEDIKIIISEVNSKNS